MAEKPSPELQAEAERLQQQAAILQQRRAAMRLLRAKQAREDLVEFTKFTMPHPEDPDNAELSRYDPQYFHRALAAALQEVEKGKRRRLIITFPPRHGKLVADSIAVLTPSGWRAHGDLRPGDYVFGPDGKPTCVIAVSDVDLASLDVKFSNGDVIKVHPNHEWTVYDGTRKKYRTIETREIIKVGLKVGRGWRFSTPRLHAIEFEEKKLPLHPYVLGAWLGDGSHNAPVICHSADDEEVISAICACGYVPTAKWEGNPGVFKTNFGSRRRGVVSLLTKGLKLAGVLRNKHIPEVYKRSSIAQRLELLAGLIDTDGTVDKSTGRMYFTNTNKLLIDDFVEIVRSLGFTAGVYTKHKSKCVSSYEGTKTSYVVNFLPLLPVPVRIPRKKPSNQSLPHRNAIVDIRPTAPEKGRCIQVDREDGLYLVGRGLTITHNSELSSKRFPAWFIGRDPYRSVIVATYNQSFAEDFGKAVRGIIKSPAYRQAFPNVELRKGSTASDRLETTEGGALFFVGRGGTVTGRGSDLTIIDDPIKNSEEARSQLVRDQLWEWFQNDIKTRFMSDTGVMVVIQTRWHSDDLVGRLTDPTNPHFDIEEAEKWEIINIPAIAGENDVLNRKPGEPLWPERFGLEYLEGFKRTNPRGFSALYQQNPTPEDGDFFQSHMITTYRAGDEPKNLRIYAASDHAVGIKQEHDKTCLLIAGVDDQHRIWILDCWWRRARTDTVVDAMIALMKKWKPLTWWAESGHISKSIGPFLFKRMAEEKVFINVSEQVPSKDKVTRAQSIQGRMSMGMVRWPSFEPWFEDAKQELLKFPNGRHDDLVDTVSHLGLGLDRIIRGAPAPEAKSSAPRVGTLAWVKHDSNFRNRQRKIAASLRGM